MKCPFLITLDTHQEQYGSSSLLNGTALFSLLNSSHLLSMLWRIHSTSCLYLQNTEAEQIAPNPNRSEFIQFMHDSIGLEDLCIRCSNFHFHMKQSGFSVMYSYTAVSVYPY